MGNFNVHITFDRTPATLGSLTIGVRPLSQTAAFTVTDTNNNGLLDPAELEVMERSAFSAILSTRDGGVARDASSIPTSFDHFKNTTHLLSYFFSGRNVRFFFEQRGAPVDGGVRSFSGDYASLLHLVSRQIPAAADGGVGDGGIEDAAIRIMNAPSPSLRPMSESRPPVFTSSVPSCEQAGNFPAYGNVGINPTTGTGCYTHPYSGSVSGANSPSQANAELRNLTGVPIWTSRLNPNLIFDPLFATIYNFWNSPHILKTPIIMNHPEQIRMLNGLAGDAVFGLSGETPAIAGERPGEAGFSPLYLYVNVNKLIGGHRLRALIQKLEMNHCVVENYVPFANVGMDSYQIDESTCDAIVDGLEDETPLRRRAREYKEFFYDWRTALPLMSLIHFGIHLGSSSFQIYGRPILNSLFPNHFPAPELSSEVSAARMAVRKMFADYRDPAVGMWRAAQWMYRGGRRVYHHFFPTPAMRVQRFMTSLRASGQVSPQARLIRAGEVYIDTNNGRYYQELSLSSSNETATYRTPSIQKVKYYLKNNQPAIPVGSREPDSEEDDNNPPDDPTSSGGVVYQQPSRPTNHASERSPRDILRGLSQGAPTRFTNHPSAEAVAVGAVTAGGARVVLTPAPTLTPTFAR